MDEKRLAEIAARSEAATPGPWSACRNGKCCCKMVWTADHPVAEIEHGVWGDDYPAVRPKTDGLDRLGDSPDHVYEAYTEMMEYGEIPEETAEANAVFIAAARTDIPDRLAEVRHLQADLAAERARTAELEDLRESVATAVIVDGKSERCMVCHYWWEIHKAERHGAECPVLLARSLAPKVEAADACL